METVIYLDVLAAINLIINYLLLVCSAKLGGLPVKRLRLLGGAALGTAYAIAAVLPELGILGSIFGKALCSLAMAAAAFGIKPAGGLWRAWIIFFAATFVFAGAVFAAALAAGGGRFLGVKNGIVYINVSFELIVICALCAYGLLGLAFGRGRAAGKGRRAVNIRLTHAGRTVGFPALLDTGCGLRDPLTNRPVLIAEYALAREILPSGAEKTAEWLKSGVPAALERLAAAGLGRYFGVVPYRTVGHKNGLLLTFRPEKAEIDGQPKNGTLIALSPERIAGGGFCAVIGL